MSDALLMKKMTQPQREEFREARVLDQLNERVRKADLIYFHHPKYGRNKHYPMKMAWTMMTQDRKRLEVYNWINANIKGKWSIDEIERLKDGRTIYNLSFERSSDAIMFKLTLADEQAR